MSSEVLRYIEQSIQQQKEFVELGASLERLKSNSDFKRVIQKGYLQDEAIRLVHAKTEPALQSVESQRLIDQQITSIGVFAQYLQLISVQSDMAKKQIESDEATREEILQGE